MAETPDDKSRALIAAMEARMRQSETFAWNVPALVIAGQSFLLTIGLDRQATAPEKEVAAAAGIAILFAGLHFMWKHSINFWIYEAVIERENKALTQHPVIGSTGERRAGVGRSHPRTTSAPGEGADSRLLTMTPHSVESQPTAPIS